MLLQVFAALGIASGASLAPLLASPSTLALIVLRESALLFPIPILLGVLLILAIRALALLAWVDRVIRPARLALIRLILPIRLLALLPRVLFTLILLIAASLVRH